MAHSQDLHIVVNGTPTLVEANVNAPLRSVVERALHQTHNGGQPPENWEMRDAAGTLLNLDAKIGALGLAPDASLFLNLRAGIGG